MNTQSSMSGLMETASYLPYFGTVTEKALTVQELKHEDEVEVLNFLAARPLHTVVMASMIHDNGMINTLNRGTFYGCRDASGDLEGCALIGHTTLIETRSEAGLKAFAPIAQACKSTFVIYGEQEKLATFWKYYSSDGRAPRLFCRESLFEQHWPVEVKVAVPGLRRATLDELDVIEKVQGQMAFEEPGVNPMERDPEGFRARCARRIEQGRSWVWMEDGRLMFRADVVSETPEVAYVEGVFVNPEERGQGYGLRCMSQLSQTLLTRVKSICLLVNEHNKQAGIFYHKAGFKMRSYYDTIYMQ